MAFQIKALVPPKMNPDLYKLEMLKAVDAEGQIVKRMYLRTVRTWSSPKPVFKVESRTQAVGPRGGKGGAVTTSVSTEDPRFIWTDLGTRAHPITARRAPRLAFRTGFKPKTRPRKIGSGRGRSFGPLTRPITVQHPGTKARKFTEEIEKRRRRPFFKAMFKAHQKGLRRAQRGR